MRTNTKQRKSVHNKSHVIWFSDRLCHSSLVPDISCTISMLLLKMMLYYLSGTRLSFARLLLLLLLWLVHGTGTEKASTAATFCAHKLARVYVSVHKQREKYKRHGFVCKRRYRTHMTACFFSQVSKVTHTSAINLVIQSLFPDPFINNFCLTLRCWCTSTFLFFLFCQRIETLAYFQYGITRTNNALHK